MHIVIAAHDLYPDPGSGGSGRYVYETARRLSGRGHRVSVITRRRGDVARRERVEGIDVYRYDLEVADRAASAILAQLPAARAAVAEHVAELTAETPPDLFSEQGPITAMLVARQLAASVPHVPTFHSPWPVEYRIRTRYTTHPVRRRLNAGLRWRLERRALMRADGAITLSAFMRDQLRRVYATDLDTAVIPGGVDTERYAPSAGHSGLLDGGEPAFLTVRRLAERMGHERLLAAFAAVVRRRPDARLYIAGDGPLRDRLERTADRHGIADCTRFLGYVPDSELPAVYASADVFVLPTTELEGFGLATLEALASGTPVIGTPIGGTVELLSALADHPFVPESPLTSGVSADALARGMLDWTDRSAAELASAGQACRQYACERYRWERSVAQVEAFYEHIVD